MSSGEDYSYKRVDDFPCPICGAKDYGLGMAYDFSTIRFISDEKTGLKRLFPANRFLRARKCYPCGNVQLFDR
jgi:hypothetical protein